MTLLQRLFHLHDWKLVGVRYGEDFVPEFIDSSMDGKFRKYTIKRFVCTKCHKTKTEKIKGYWTLEELSPTS